MDIYDFINSTAISNHLKSCDYKFNSLETAWLIYQSTDKTYEEKHKAWKWLIENMPDYEVRNRVTGEFEFNLHHFLDSYLKAEDKLCQIFDKEEESAVYQYSFFCNGDQSWCEDFTELYWSKEDCWEKIREDLDLGISRIIVRKRYVGKECAYIDAEFTADEKLVSIYSAGILDEEDWNILNGVFDGLWFDFPIPFKKGDVVYQRQKPGPRFEELIFVLDDAIPLNESIKNMDFYKKWADNSDMSAWGYFQDDDGRVYHECMHNYMDLEYFDGPYEGRLRLLKAIGAFVKGEIDISLLLTTYRKVILDEFTNDVMLTSWFADEELAKAGLK